MTDHEVTTKVWRYILQFKADHDGAMPTVREIQAATKLSSSSVAYYQMRKLETFGYLYRQDGRWCVRGSTWTPPPDFRREDE